MATRRPSALALPLEHHEPAQQPRATRRNNVLGRFLKRRGGNSAGKANIQAPLAEAVGTGILTLAIGLMSAASGGLSGAWVWVWVPRVDWGGSEVVGWGVGRVQVGLGWMDQAESTDPMTQLTRIQSIHRRRQGRRRGRHALHAAARQQVLREPPQPDRDGRVG